MIKHMKKLIIYISLAIFGLVIFGILQYGISQTNSEIKKNRKADSAAKGYPNKENSDKLIAYNLMAYEVRKSLKESSTAEFPNTNQKLKHIKLLEKKSYSINSWVDSRDTYGAMTRKKFSCTFKTDGSKVIYEQLIIDKEGYILKNR